MNILIVDDETEEVEVDSEEDFGLIKIKALSCWQSSPYDLSENKILLEISEKKIGMKEYQNIFLFAPLIS